MAEDKRAEFEQAMRRWARVFMHRSMHGFAMHLRSNHLSMSQMGALMHVQHHGTCAVAAIGDGLGVTSAAVSQIVDRLVEQGMVHREEDPEDRRAKRIHLTPVGIAAVDRAIRARQQWFADLAGSMTDDEMDVATTTLRMLAERASIHEEHA